MLKYIIAVMFTVFVSYSQTEHMSVSGHITDTNGKPVAGATVRVEKTVLGTYAGKNGNFKINKLPKEEATLIITSIGYRTVKKTINAKTNPFLNIEMDESPVTTAPVVVTGTKNEQLYEDSPVKISVISNKVFSSTSSLNIKEGLSFQPGLRIENSCQNCGMSQIRINGMEGQYSQVLIDGKAVFSSLNSVYGLEQIPSQMIDRIEVIRGGGSSLYGGNAIAGVVNVITKDPFENSLSVKINQAYTGMSNSNNNINLSGSIINSSQNAGAYIFAVNQARDAYDANSDGFSEIANLDMTAIGARMFYNPSQYSRIGLEYHFINDERRGGNKFDLPLHESDISEYAAHNIHSAQLNYESFINSNNKISLYLSGQNTVRNSFYGTNETPDAYGKTNNSSLATGFQYTNINENLFGEHVFTIGTEYNNDEIEDVAVAYDRNLEQSVNQMGLYLQDDWAMLERLNLVYGFRIDKHNMIDDLIFSPRMNIMYKISDHFTARGNVSTGFRAPQAFDEDLHIATVGGELQLIELGDNLKEEKSFSYGISLDNNFELFGKTISLSTEFFHTDLTDAFILEEAGQDGNGNQILLKRNGQEAFVQGITFESQITFNSTDYLKGGITYQKSEYSEPVEWSDGGGISTSQSSEKIFKTPDFYGYFNAGINIIKELNLFISGIYTGNMYVPHYAGGINPQGYLIEEDELKSTKDFFELNGKLSYIFNYSTQFTLSLGMHNILNSFQTDFDSGRNRDAGYVYGPLKPRTAYMEIEVGI
jgi:outer membrane receptor for ferrienterochelin and colicins